MSPFTFKNITEGGFVRSVFKKQPEFTESEVLGGAHYAAQKKDKAGATSTMSVCSNIEYSNIIYLHIASVSTSVSTSGSSDSSSGALSVEFSLNLLVSGKDHFTKVALLLEDVLLDAQSQPLLLVIEGVCGVEYI